ncbi:MAG: DoxX family protein [Rhodanobacteraceae bacterium]|nr:DoxX family protein [Rhodanobacteraceae bacterium]MBL0042377.1 DoxX family protein [Xanthomonadales bacterium]
MPRFPFLSLNHGLAVLRIGTALLFMAHAVVRIANGTIPRFADFLGALGFPQPLLWVWAITLVEIIGGGLMILGIKVRWMALGLLSIAAGGIVLIHARQGWFVGEHGTGGSEYSVCLILCLLVIAAADAERSARRD